MNRRHYAVSLQQASEESPTLARLAGLARESGARLQALLPLMPPALRPLVRPGPIEGDTWCLLVQSNAAASKIRQLLPAFETHLRSQGCALGAIRLKIQTSPSP